MHRLLHALGNPHDRWRAVHVAGTKGKGSTAALLSAILTAADYRVGTYSSPHVASFNERIALDCLPISDAELDGLVRRHAPAIEAAAAAEGGALSHFEVATALAFAHFAERKVDIGVVETGLGGVRDATNVFSPSALAAAVLTAVGSDHAAALGGGLEQIAAAKAGIMKEGRPAVLARQPEAAAERVLHEAAERLGCDLLAAPAEVQLTPRRLAPALGGGLAQRCTLRLAGPRTQAAFGGSDAANGSDPAADGCDVELRLLGRHQLDNAAAAITAAAVLWEQGLGRLDLPAVAAGLATAELPGRFQLCRFSEDDRPKAEQGQAQAGGDGATTAGAGAGAPLVVLDGAHTPESAAALAATLRAAYPSATVALVLAMAEDKEHREVCVELRALEPEVVVFTQVAIAGGAGRAAGPGQLAGAWQAAAILGGGRRKGGTRARELIQASLPAAVEAARRELAARVRTSPGGGSSNSSGSGSGSGPNSAAAPAGILLVTGSLHAVGAALRQLDLRPN